MDDILQLLPVFKARFLKTEICLASQGSKNVNIKAKIFVKSHVCSVFSIFVWPCLRIISIKQFVPKSKAFGVYLRISI